MESFTVRRAHPEDAGAITALVQAAYAPYLSRMPRRPAPMDDDYAAAVAEADVWVAELPHAPEKAGNGDGDTSGAIVGVVVVRWAEDHLLVDNLAVDPAAQGCGVGAHLLRVVDELACTAGVHEIRLYTNVAMTENLSYYPRHGFVETHRARQDGFDRVFFSRTVRAGGL